METIDKGSDKDRVSLILEINGKLLFEALEARSAANSSKSALTSVFSSCMKRLEANLAYLALVADRSSKSHSSNLNQQTNPAILAPAILTPPPELPSLFPLYSKLALLFPGQVSTLNNPLSPSNNTIDNSNNNKNNNNIQSPNAFTQSVYKSPVNNNDLDTQPPIQNYNQQQIQPQNKLQAQLAIQSPNQSPDQTLNQLSNQPQRQQNKSQSQLPGQLQNQPLSLPQNLPQNQLLNKNTNLNQNIHSQPMDIPKAISDPPRPTQFRNKHPSSFQLPVAQNRISSNHLHPQPLSQSQQIKNNIDLHQLQTQILIKQQANQQQKLNQQNEKPSNENHIDLPFIHQQVPSNKVPTSSQHFTATKNSSQSPMTNNLTQPSTSSPQINNQSYNIVSNSTNNSNILQQDMSIQHIPSRFPSLTSKSSPKQFSNDIINPENILKDIDMFSQPPTSVDLFSNSKISQQHPHSQPSPIMVGDGIPTRTSSSNIVIPNSITSPHLPSVPTVSSTTPSLPNVPLMSSNRIPSVNFDNVDSLQNDNNNNNNLSIINEQNITNNIIPNINEQSNPNNIISNINEQNNENNISNYNLVGQNDNNSDSKIISSNNGLDQIRDPMHGIDLPLLQGNYMNMDSTSPIGFSLDSGTLSNDPPSSVFDIDGDMADNISQMFAQFNSE